MTAGDNKKGVIVGIFIAVGCLIFILGILALSWQRKSFGHTTTVKAYFADVSGLKVGSNILYSGVKVGTVKDITLLPDARVEVDMAIDDKMKQLIPKDVIAKIGSDGVIGSKMILLYGGTANTQGIKTGNTLKTESAISTDDLFNTFQVTNKNLTDITNDLKQITHRVATGQGTIGKLVQDDAIAGELQRVLDGLKATSLNAQSLTGDIKNYTAQLQKPGSLTYNLISDTVVFGRLRGTARRLDELSLSAKGIVDKLSTVSNHLSDTTASVGLLLQDKTTADDIKVIINNLQSATQKLDEDMEALKHNFLFRGYFKKKEKQAQ